MSSIAQRRDKFEAHLHKYAKNDFDTHIKGFRKSDPSKPYLLTLKGLKGIKIPASVKGLAEDIHTSAEFHLTFFYNNPAQKKKFFFGRTSRSSILELQK